MLQKLINYNHNQFYSLLYTKKKQQRKIDFGDKIKPKPNIPNMQSKMPINMLYGS